MEDQAFLDLLPKLSNIRTVVEWVDRFYKFSKVGNAGAAGLVKKDFKDLASMVGVSDKGSLKELIKKILTTEMYVLSSSHSI